MDLVTIITPVYNGEKYLQRYFAQINAIGYKNLQIIVVNDGSKDETSEIVQKYAEEDSRIHIFFTQTSRSEIKIQCLLDLRSV